MKKQKEEKKKKSLTREILEWILTIVVAIAIALPIRAFGFELVWAGPSLELSSRLEAGGCAVGTSPGRLGSLAEPQRRGTSP